MIQIRTAAERGRFNHGWLDTYHTFSFGDYLATIDANNDLSHNLAKDRHAWLQVLRGAVSLNGHSLQAGDGAAVSGVTLLTITGDGEVMLFDLA